MMRKFRCPICGKTVKEYPALSRLDNKTEICSECGTREALLSFGLFSTAEANQFAKHLTEQV